MSEYSVNSAKNEFQKQMEDIEKMINEKVSTNNEKLMVLDMKKKRLQAELSNMKKRRSSKENDKRKSVRYNNNMRFNKIRYYGSDAQQKSKDHRKNTV